MKKVCCLICGAVFETNKPNKKYCSLLCREAGRQLSQMKRKQRDPEYMTRYMRKYREKKRNES